MMTPDDAKRLVKNRNAREAYSQTAFDRAQEEELDLAEEEVVAYLSESDFLDYVTGQVDIAMEEAINGHLPLHVAFYDHRVGRIVGDISEVVAFDERGRQEYEDVQLMAFDARECGIDYDADEIAWLLMQSVRFLYQEQGWDTGGNENRHKYRLYQQYEAISPYRASIDAYSFELFD